MMPKMEGHAEKKGEIFFSDFNEHPMFYSRSSQKRLLKTNEWDMNLIDMTKSQML